MPSVPPITKVSRRIPPLSPRQLNLLRCQNLSFLRFPRWVLSLASLSRRSIQEFYRPTISPSNRLQYLLHFHLSLLSDDRRINPKSPSFFHQRLQLWRLLFKLLLLLPPLVSSLSASSMLFFLFLKKNRFDCY